VAGLGFRHYFAETVAAVAAPICCSCWARLDNVVFAWVLHQPALKRARSFHKAITVNGQSVNIPSCK
jgi:hypothetical protein